MKNSRRIIAIISALTILGSAASCGQDAATESSLVDEPIVSVTTNSEEDDSSEKSTDAVSDSNDAQDTTEKENSTEADNSSDNQETTTALSGEDLHEQTTAAENEAPAVQTTAQKNNASSNTQTNSAGNTSQNPSTGNTGSSGQSSNQQSGSSGNASSSGNTSSGNSSSQETTEAPTEEVKTYAAEVVLGSSPKISGSNVTANSSGIVITAGGDYLISGSVTNGMIEVSTKEKVKIYMDGVTISNSSGPAIQVTDAKRFIMVLKEGTTTRLSDGGSNSVYDGAIFSNDTVEIKGKGSLEITANNAHGISSDDDVVIENGNITITSKKTGIMANDDITINDGTLNIKSGTNGLKSKGTMNINGGYSIIAGGTKEEKSSVYAAGALNYTGGYLYAAGNAVTAPTTSASPYAIVGYSSACAAGSNVTLSINGAQAVSFTPHNSFKCVMMLTPDLAVGSTAGINIAGAYNEFTISDTANIFQV